MGRMQYAPTSRYILTTELPLMIRCDDEWGDVIPPLLFQRPGAVYGPATNPDNRLTMAPRPDVPKRTGLFSLHREVFTFAAVPL